MYLKDSITDVIGLSIIIHLYFSERKDNGYTTGVANISNCTPNPTRNLRSLYFVVNDEMIIPNPRPNPAIIIRRKGVTKT